MAGYVKRLALIKTLKAGYSADGGPLKGIIRCEAYAGYFRAEASLINFAPLSDGCYRIGMTDGDCAVIFDPPSFEGDCKLDPSRGFACLIAFCRGGEVRPVASAVCGDNEKLLAAVQSAIEREESPPKPAYDDEAIADVNYYELENDKDDRDVRPPEGGKDGQDACQNEDDPRLSPGEKGAKYSTAPAATDGERVKCSTRSFRIGGSPKDDEDAPQVGDPCPADGDEAAQPRLAGGGFFERMSGDIKNIFSTYPRLTALEDVIDGSKWAKISYGNGLHYAFGVIYDGGNAKFLCYAVPVETDAPCPESLKGRASYVPVDGGGYWIMYQDAETGISINAN